MSAPRLAALCATLAALLCACKDTNPQQPPAVEVKRKDELPKWLTPIDRVDPAYWLAARKSGGAPVDEGREERLRAALEVGAAHFLESPRMLANRAAQLADMMAEIGAAEDEAESIESLARVAAATGSKQTFGDLCQHYFNLRKQGATRDSALADLRERYCAQNRGQ
ncbi:hypothetical protein FM996_05530 [Methylosinus sporium]|uniref:MxaH protein n=1 Tax=Methylosinus sporium TaxID=428 RepID=A0A549T2W3_METSR|nr:MULTISPECIES: hypothetical protein [Methylosinus]MBU3889500.1 hypothetical protein [Methylosinus sp. KRF6]TRL36228.1 hypothetical protein FM996_05530 [Methylosinus sporium]